MRVARHLILISLLTTVTGCASLGVRLGSYSDQRSERPILYPTTSTDVGVVSYVLARPFKTFTDPSFTPDAQEGLVYLHLPFSIVDLPVAAALDTVLLPYDIYRRHTYVPEGSVDPDQYLRDTEPL